MRFHVCNSRREFDTLERAIPSTSAISSAASGCLDAYKSAWIWLTERLTPQRSPKFPHSKTNCRTASGTPSLMSVVSVMTDITDHWRHLVKICPECGCALPGAQDFTWV